VARLTRRLAVAAAAIAAAAGLAACGGGTNSSAVAACGGVHRALADFARSQHAPTRAIAAADLAAAQHQIALVMQDAAIANSQDGTYNALMTLMQQAQEVPFRDVVPALTVECRAVDSPTGFL